MKQKAYPSKHKKTVVRIGIPAAVLVISVALILTAVLLLCRDPSMKQTGREESPTLSNLAAAALPEPEEKNEDWALILVNHWNPVPDGYKMDLIPMSGGHHAVDRRIYSDLQAMLDDAQNAGMLPKISESYRTASDQQALMDEKIAEYQKQGNSYEDAKALAEKWVAVPGTSEHQIGLAVDITTANREKQDAAFIWKWLRENSYKYGFILRYTEEKSQITGCINEPWHYRYVGKQAAKEIYEQGLCLEEYIQQKGDQ